MGAWVPVRSTTTTPADFSAELRDLVDGEVAGQICSRARRGVGPDDEVEVGQVCEAIAAAVMVAVAACADAAFLAAP